MSGPALDDLAASVVDRYRQEELDRRGRMNDPSPWEGDAWTWLHKFLTPYFRHKPAEHHQEFYEHLWSIEPDVTPEPLVFCVTRKGGKSMNMEAGGVALGARKKRKYILYFSETQTQSENHLLSIRDLLMYETFAEYYPMMSSAKMQDFSSGTAGWNRQRLWTEEGTIFDQYSLQAHYRGLKIGMVTPDVIFLDDFDNRKDSVATTIKKLEIIRDDILPLGALGSCAVFLGQNLIIDSGVLAQIIDGRAGFLLNRRVIGPIPALRNMKYETKPGKRAGDPDVFKLPKTPGVNVPTWEGLNRAKCELLLNEYGLEGFLREFQHDTKTFSAGHIYKTYLETHHIVTKTEVMRTFAAYKIKWSDDKGKFKVPFHLRKQMSLDSGYTPEHPSALKWATRAAQFEPHADIVMWYRERNRPAWPSKRTAAIEPVSPIRIYRLIVEAEAAWQEAENMDLRVMSHEQLATRATMNSMEDWLEIIRAAVEPSGEINREDVPHELIPYANLGFVSVRPDKRGGIAQMQNYFEIDFSRDHPFRHYPDGYHDDAGDDLSGQPLKGRPKQIFIVDDDQGELYLDNEGKLCVRQAFNDDGMVRSRAERLKYVNPKNQSGVEVNEPPKIFNDQMDAERFLAGRSGSFFLGSAEPTRNQLREKTLPQNLRLDAIIVAPEEQRPQLMAERQIEIAVFEQENPKDVFHSAVARARAKLGKRRK